MSFLFSCHAFLVEVPFKEMSAAALLVRKSPGRTRVLLEIGCFVHRLFEQRVHELRAPVTRTPRLAYQKEHVASELLTDLHERQDAAWLEGRSEKRTQFYINLICQCFLKRNFYL